MLITLIPPIQPHNDGWILQNYTMTNKKIISNVYPNIFEGTNINNQQPVTIKCISCKNVDMKQFEMIINTTPVPSPFILSLRDVFLCKQNETFYLVFDGCVGSLNSYLAKNLTDQLPGSTKNMLPENEALEIFFQIVEGCAWLWGNNIIHRNIKLECIFYRFDENLQKNIFFICDFGVSTFKPCLIVGEDGNSPYMTPETVMNDQSDYLEDVRCLGLVLYEMLFGETYYNDPDGGMIQNKIMSTEYKHSFDQNQVISTKTAYLLERMAKQNPKERITNEELQKAVREFREYESVRNVLYELKHMKRALKNNQNAEDAYLQYAKKLMNNAWKISLDGYDEISKDMNEEALEIYVNMLGVDSAETKFAMIRYAQDLMFLEQIEKAKFFGDMALGLYEKNKNENDSDFARAYMIVGNIYDDLEDYNTSKMFLENAVKMRLNINGEYHRETAATIDNLGGTLRSRQDLINAKKCHEKSVKIYKKIFGEKHFEISLSYYNLSLILYDLKDYKKAFNFCRKAKIISEKHYGKSHYNTINAEDHELKIVEALKKKSTA